MYSWDAAWLHSEGVNRYISNSYRLFFICDNAQSLKNSSTGEKIVDDLFARTRYHHGTNGPARTGVSGSAGGSGQLWSTHVPR